MKAPELSEFFAKESLGVHQAILQQCLRTALSDLWEEARSSPVRSETTTENDAMLFFVCVNLRYNRLLRTMYPNVYPKDPDKELDCLREENAELRSQLETTGVLRRAPMRNG